MDNVAIITARGGSKRIPRKNTRLFLGKPIIAYTIDVALKSGMFKDVIVSTDDDEIAEIASSYGASVPFMRSEKNSDDFAGTDDVMLEVLISLLEKGKSYTHACCLYPTAPFIDIQSLRKAYDLMLDQQFDTVFPVCAFSYPVQRSLIMAGDGKVVMNWPENLHKRSQDLRPSYHDAGQFYWVNIASFLNTKNLYTDNTGAIVLDELRVQDIDNETDWKLAELNY